MIPEPNATMRNATPDSEERIRIASVYNGMERSGECRRAWIAAAAVLGLSLLTCDLDRAARTIPAPVLPFGTLLEATLNPDPCPTCGMGAVSPSDRIFLGLWKR